MKLGSVIALLLLTSPVAAQTTTSTFAATSSTSSTSSGASADEICDELMTATFCNEPTSPNTSGYGTNGGAAATSTGITTPSPAIPFSMAQCGEVQCQERSVNPGTLNWDQTSEDYSKYRPGYPDSYFLLLQELGIGLKNQDILDIGTGTGALALPFAKQGAHVTGVDISRGQIEAAKTLASQKKLNVRFIVAKAEETGLPDKSFDVITSSMSWGYLDQKKMPEEAARLLRKNGLLLISSLNWVREADAITQRTGELLKKYGSERKHQRRREAAYIIPEWAKDKFQLKTYHTYYVVIPFTKESWRGRIRASRSVGAILSREKIEEFDRELQKLLDDIGEDHFDVKHRITFYIFELKS
jgi:ubiquinone/menaquinone biosynthesis C-methylase UbiE